MNICYDYGTNIDILFNETKTKCVIFKSKKDNFVDYQCVVLGNQKISYCKEQKYLGHMYSNDLSDDDDIWRQTRSIYARGNAIHEITILVTSRENRPFQGSHIEQLGIRHLDTFLFDYP